MKVRLSIIALVLFLISYSTASAQFTILGYTYGMGKDTEVNTQQTEHGFSLSHGFANKNTGGTAYISGAFSIGRLEYSGSNSVGIGGPYQRFLVSVSGEYSPLSKRVQPYLGVGLSIGSISHHKNQEVRSPIYGGGPMVGIRIYLTRNLSLNGSVRKIFWGVEEKQIITLSPLDLLSIGLRFAIKT